MITEGAHQISRDEATARILATKAERNLTLFYEIVHVYGTTIKAVVHEMFGDGIVSAIDFEMDIQKKEDPKGDRVVITMNGKFLPYRKW